MQAKGEANQRYLALECISKFSQLPIADVIIKEKLDVILLLLRDPDISIAKRALDILYLLCTPTESPRVIKELLKFSDAAPPNIKEELVLKIVILAEKFAEDILWYIDVVVRLITSSGNYITDEIWYRVI